MHIQLKYFLYTIFIKICIFAILLYNIKNNNNILLYNYIITTKLLLKLFKQNYIIIFCLYNIKICICYFASFFNPSTRFVRWEFIIVNMLYVTRIRRSALAYEEKCYSLGGINSLIILSNEKFNGHPI